MLSDLSLDCRQKYEQMFKSLILWFGSAGHVRQGEISNASLLESFCIADVFLEKLAWL